ncbi:MAG TPA: hypothetical protein VMZ30_19075 [Pyrinomonadaceae bacterium]|nr:hypothetical protein [Pyrinomonadaceae bacterium]
MRSTEFVDLRRSVVEENNEKYMENSRRALWLILLSQFLFLVGSFIDWPTRPVMIVFRVVLPLIIIAYLCLILAGYISPRKRQ